MSPIASLGRGGVGCVTVAKSLFAPRTRRLLLGSRAKRGNRASVTYTILPSILLSLLLKDVVVRRYTRRRPESVFAARQKRLQSGNSFCRGDTDLYRQPLWSSPFFKGELEGVVCRVSIQTQLKRKLNIEYRTRNNEG